MTCSVAKTKPSLWALRRGEGGCWVVDKSIDPLQPLCVCVCVCVVRGEKCVMIHPSYHWNPTHLNKTYNIMSHSEITTFCGKHGSLIVSSYRSSCQKPHPPTLFQSKTTADLISHCLTCVINHKSWMKPLPHFDTICQRNSWQRSDTRLPPVVMIGTMWAWHVESTASAERGWQWQIEEKGCTEMTEQKQTGRL